MGLFEEIESIKYRFVLDLIKNDEPYDKKKNTLNGEEVFALCHKRYQLMKNILLPLKEKLGDNIEIIDINFADMQDNFSIMVRYSKNSRQNYFTISRSDFNDIEVSSSDNDLEKYDFVILNKKIILDIFKQIYHESLDCEFYINSTSKKFMILDNCKNFNIKDSNNKIFSLECAHLVYEKNNLLCSNEKTLSAYQKLKELLLDYANVLKIYQHLHIYEEDFPQVLKKTN